MFAHPYRLALMAAWLFVIAVTVYDIRWAFDHSETVNVWEANPLMRWVMQNFGVWVGGIARFLTVGFAACLMPLAPKRSQISGTLAIVTIHTYLAGIYAVILATTSMKC